MRPSRTVAGVIALVALGVVSLGARQTASPPNTLTAAETAAGWKLLFDGKTSNGWRGFHRDAFPTQGWLIADGAITHAKSVTGGDIITVGEYENFEFKVD